MSAGVRLGARSVTVMRCFAASTTSRTLPYMWTVLTRRLSDGQCARLEMNMFADKMPFGWRNPLREEDEEEDPNEEIKVHELKSKNPVV